MLKVWDLGTGKLIDTREKVSTKAVAFDAAGRVAVAAPDGKKVLFHTVRE